MPKRNIVWILVGAVIAVLLWKAPESYIRRDALYDRFGPLLDVYVQVAKNYVEPVDDEELLHGAIDGMLDRLDPYCAYFTSEEYKEFQKQTQGEFPGIGIHVAKPPGIGLVVVSPMEGTPAFRAGLRSGDRITHVNGTETADLSLEECVKLITGPAGTSVTLTIQRPGVEEPFDVTITRSVVNVPTVRGWARTSDWQWDYLIDPRYRIGYVRILGFEARTAEQFNRIVRELITEAKMRGLVLDVRDNPGGLLDVVVDIANRFLSEGLIVSTKGRRTPEVPYLATREDTYPDFPVVVLVNGGSASASEILAGALRDHGRAVLVGEKTFGKGSVQEILPIENTNGMLKLTTAYYFLPSGQIINGKGIVPDRIVDLTPSEREAMIASWQAVYATGDLPETVPATVPATQLAPPAGPESGLNPAQSRPTGGAAALPGSGPATVPAGWSVLHEPAASEVARQEPRRFEILIDRQLREALDIVRAKLRALEGAPATAPQAE